MSFRKPRYPIMEIMNYKDTNSGAINRTAMIDSLSEFIDNNLDFDNNFYLAVRDYSLQPSNLLIRDYETAVTLSHWDDIQAKFGQKINDVSE